MQSNLIWWTGTSLLALILIRGVQAKLLQRYPLFYRYIGCVLLKEIVGLLSYHFAPSFYEPLYWPTELATIVASYAVIIEIFRSSLRHNPGIAAKSQKFLFVLFAFAASYAATDILHEGFVSGAHTIAELGRDLRYIEGVLLVVMLWLLVRYRISLGRNLLGLAGGYSFWVGINAVNLALLFLPGTGFSDLLRKLLPITYVATLTIWCFALWSCQPEPVQPNENAIERDYDVLAANTRGVLARTSARFMKALRP
jgi:uncharacterized membrane protein